MKSGKFAGKSPLQHEKDLPVSQTALNNLRVALNTEMKRTQPKSSSNIETRLNWVTEMDC